MAEKTRETEPRAAEAWVTRVEPSEHRDLAIVARFPAPVAATLALVVVEGAGTGAARLLGSVDSGPDDAQALRLEVPADVAFGTDGGPDLRVMLEGAAAWRPLHAIVAPGRPPPEWLEAAVLERSSTLGAGGVAPGTTLELVSAGKLSSRPGKGWPVCSMQPEGYTHTTWEVEQMRTLFALGGSTRRVCEWTRNVTARRGARAVVVSPRWVITEESHSVCVIEMPELFGLPDPYVEISAFCDTSTTDWTRFAGTELEVRSAGVGDEVEAILATEPELKVRFTIDEAGTPIVSDVAR